MANVLDFVLCGILVLLIWLGGLMLFFGLIYVQRSRKDRH